MFNILLQSGRINELISVKGIDFLVHFIAFGENFPIEELFKKFKSSFHSEFNYKLENTKNRVSKLKEGQKIRLQTALKIEFIHFLEDILIKKYEISPDFKISSMYIYQSVRDISAEKLCLLYNTMGFEVLAYLFQGLK